MTDLTPDSFSNQTESLSFAVKASSEGGSIKTVTLYTKYEGQEEFEAAIWNAPMATPLRKH